tara:strand:+ start:387 stop:620 length:234 start_codon:yes stop_codon:yes gene_type:complete
MKQTIEQVKRIVLELKHYFEKSLPLILIGVALGYAFANHLETQRAEPVEIGFATVEDMSFLVQELKECKDNTLDGSY